MLERFDCVPLFFAPFVSSVMRIEPHWIDYNGHLNMAYYNVLFDRAVDETYELIGVGADYVVSRAHSAYTAEVHVRYLRWIGAALNGDFGVSYAYGSPVAPLIASSLAVSLPLAVLAMALSAAIALLAGVYAADRRGRAGDAIVMGLSQIGLAVPNFWLAILMVIVFAVTLFRFARSAD